MDSVIPTCLPKVGSTVSSMLPKEDLDQIAEIMRSSIFPLEKKTDSFERGVGKLEKEVLAVRKDVKRLDKKLDFVTGIFDDELTRLSRQMLSLETKLHLEN